MVEDLMREHGVVRRVMISIAKRCRFFARRRRTLMRLRWERRQPSSGHYHEARLEEQHVFPAARRIGGEAAALVDTLMAQHMRGREITDFIRSKCTTGKVASGDAEPLASALESFVRMYDAHAAYEDTIVFQAWKRSMSANQLQETGEQFEDIEHELFKGDGFDIAIDRIAGIEQRLGLHDLGRFTAPAPA